MGWLPGRHRPASPWEHRAGGATTTPRDRDADAEPSGVASRPSRGGGERPPAAAAVAELPAADRDHRSPGAEPEGDLRERPVAAAHRDQRLRRARDDRVSRETKPGDHRDVDELVGLARVVAGENAHGQPACLASAPAGLAHDAAPATAHQRVPALGELPPDLVCESRVSRVGRLCADHADHETAPRGRHATPPGSRGPVPDRGAPPGRGELRWRRRRRLGARHRDR